MLHQSQSASWTTPKARSGDIWTLDPTLNLFRTHLSPYGLTQVRHTIGHLCPALDPRRTHLSPYRLEWVSDGSLVGCKGGNLTWGHVGSTWVALVFAHMGLRCGQTLVLPMWNPHAPHVKLPICSPGAI